MYPIWYNFIPAFGGLAVLVLFAAASSLVDSAKQAFCEHFPERCPSNVNVHAH